MKKSTAIRSLLLSGLSMLLCFSMLIGSTFAWFTDEVKSGTNTIIAGNLDVELYHSDKNASDVKVDSTTVLFDDVDSNKWEPGAMAWEKFTVVNEGNLALKYQLTLNALNATVINGTSFASMLKVAVVDGTFTYTRENVAAIDADKWSDLATFTLEGELEKQGDEAIHGIIIWWQPSDLDNLFNMNNGQTVGSVKVDVGVNLFATQLDAEEDSFGNDYDAEAPIVSAPVARPTTGTAINLKGAEDVVIGLPADVVENLPAGVTEIGLSVSEPVVDATAKTITFASIELVDQSGDVIDLEALNTNTNITVTLPAQTTFAPGETVVLYHDGEYVAAAVVNADTTITYEVAHLCEVSVGAVEVPADKDGVIEIANATQLFGFAQSVNAGNYYAGKKVVLTADIDLKNAKWTPIGNFTYDITTNGDGYVYGNTFKGTFDGQGHTIKNLYVNAPETSGVGLFGYVTDATVMNLTIENVKLNALSHVAAFVARARGTSTVTNCNLTGDIDINAYWAYVAGIVGKAYAINLDNCTVTPNGTGKITSENRNAVGSILAWMESASTVSNCDAQDLNLTGWANIGAISGFVNNNGTIANCSAKNITLTKTRADGIGTIGLAAGGWCGNNITIKDNTFDTITLNGNMVPNASVDVLFGGEFYGSGNASTVTASNNTQTNITDNRVEVTAVSTADQLISAFEKGGNVVLTADLAVTEGLTLANGKTLVLDLNGHTISGTDNGTASFGLITNKGNLTITGNGKMTLAATQNRGWNAYSSVISNTVGGKLVVESGTLEHLGGTDMAYAIDNLTNGKGTYAETVINGGTIKSTYRAIRMFLNGTEAQNILTVNGGVIEGANKSIWMQDPSANANSGTLTVSENAVLNGDVYVYATLGSTEFPATVAIADKALSEESEVVEGNLANVNKAIANVNGVWTLVAAN